MRTWLLLLSHLETLLLVTLDYMLLLMPAPGTLLLSTSLLLSSRLLSERHLGSNYLGDSLLLSPRALVHLAQVYHKVLIIVEHFSAWGALVVWTLMTLVYFSRMYHSVNPRSGQVGRYISTKVTLYPFVFFLRMFFK